MADTVEIEGSVIERLEHAMTTAANDDYSKPLTTERARHVARLAAMSAAREEIERLRAELKDAGGYLSAFIAEHPDPGTGALACVHRIEAINR